VEYAKFQDAVLALADGGTRLTKTSVALRLGVTPVTAGELLDRMTRDGKLELDIDEASGEIFYELRARAGARAASAPGTTGAPARPIEGRKPSDGAKALRTLGSALERGGLAAKVGTALALGDDGGLPEERRRKIALGVVLGGLFPGLGLAYTAPWPVVVATSVVVIIGYKLLALIPIFSSFLLVPFLVVCAVASGVLGGLYTWRYNQAGKRAAIGDEPVSPKKLLERFTKKQ
jgi:hypothetical protein